MPLAYDTLSSIVGFELVDQQRPQRCTVAPYVVVTVAVLFADTAVIEDMLPIVNVAVPLRVCMLQISP